MYLDFKQMPKHARVWVYQADRKLTTEEIIWIKERLEAFCAQWNTHGALMPTSFTIVFDQVIVMSVDESKLGASGCSIDSSVRTLKEIETKLGINLLDQGKVSFQVGGQNFFVTSAFQVKDKIQQGMLNPETLILNPLVKTKEELEEQLLIQAKDSWLNKYFSN
jgi:hypothetical protein